LRKRGSRKSRENSADIGNGEQWKAATIPCSAARRSLSALRAL
jgi:hypothetical protein